MTRLIVQLILAGLVVQDPTAAVIRRGRLTGNVAVCTESAHRAVIVVDTDVDGRVDRGFGVVLLRPLTGDLLGPWPDSVVDYTESVVKLTNADRSIQFVLQRGERQVELPKIAVLDRRRTYVYPASEILRLWNSTKALAASCGVLPHTK